MASRRSQFKLAASCWEFETDKEGTRVETVGTMLGDQGKKLNLSNHWLVIWHVSLYMSNSFNLSLGKGRQRRLDDTELEQTTEEFIWDPDFWLHHTLPFSTRADNNVPLQPLQMRTTCIAFASGSRSPSCRSELLSPIYRIYAHFILS